MGYILLKWGTLKGYKEINNDTLLILQKWDELGASISCMAQRNTPEQKKLLCDAIDAHDGTIKNDWSGEEYTKEQAKEYINSYGKGA